MAQQRIRRPLARGAHIVLSISLLTLGASHECRGFLASLFLASVYGTVRTKQIHDTLQNTTPDSDETEQETAATPEQPRTTSADVAGGFNDDVRQVVSYINDGERLRRLGAHLPKGVLLHGPPGTGKTLIARAIAGEAQAGFLHANGSEFIHMYVGTGAQKVRELFQQARDYLANGHAYVVIFIDEIDAIGGSRNGGENTEYRSTLNELLNQMDGFDGSDNIIVIAATNDKESLDSALTRPGRFDRKVHIGLPSLQTRAAIIDYYLQRISYEDDQYTKSCERYARATRGWSGAELRTMVNEAAFCAERAGAEVVTPEHVWQAHAKVKAQK